MKISEIERVLKEVYNACSFDWETASDHLKERCVEEVRRSADGLLTQIEKERKSLLERINDEMTKVKKQGGEPKRLYVGKQEKDALDNMVSNRTWFPTMTLHLTTVYGVEIIEVEKENHLECV